MPVMLISLTIEDADGDKSSASVYATRDEGATPADLETDYVTVFWEAIQPIITGVLVRATVTLEMDVGALINNTPSAISDVQEKAVFQIRVCDGSRPVRFSLPTIKESIFTNSGAGSQVDVTNTDYTYFAYVMTSGIEDGGINATDSHGSDLCQVLSGEQFFGKG